MVRVATRTFRRAGHPGGRAPRARSRIPAILVPSTSNEDRDSTSAPGGGRQWSLRTKSFDILFASIVGLVLFGVHARWVLTHFSSDAYLHDSGWLAYLFASADPFLHNPSGIDNLTFYDHHLSPHIFLFGAPLSRLFGLSGFWIFAIHQGFFFAVLFLSVYLLAAAGHLPWRRKAIAVSVAVCVGAFGNVVLQAAAYPHFEVAMAALCSLGLSAWAIGRYRLFAVCLLWLPLVREDGGLLVAFTALACLVLSHRQADAIKGQTRLLLAVAAAGILVSMLSMAAHARFFHGFDAFSFNFSGHSWDHLSASLIAKRVYAMATSLNTGPVLWGCIVLLAFDRLYATGLVLLSPLLLLYLVAVRDEHGYFTTYYALPWLLPCTIWLVVLVRRFRAEAVGAAEWMLVLGCVMLGTAPIQAALGEKSQYWYVAEWAVERPVANLQAMQEFAGWVRRESANGSEGPHVEARNCVSLGIAGLIPNQVRPDEVLTPGDDLGTCRTVLLMRGDMHYPALVEHARAARFQLVAQNETAELWYR
jgi:hypothetical protein